MSFVALDLGTSFIKGAVLDLDALRLCNIQRIPFPDPLPNQSSSLCEIDPRAVVAATQEIINRLLPHAPDCKGLVMCGQMQGLVLANERGEF
jgi:sugar (pentulose or hexulose) kinase